MKKKLTVFIILHCLIGNVFADDTQTIKNIIKENSGYYYCNKYNEIIYVGLRENTLIEKSYRFDFRTNNIRIGSSGESDISSDFQVVQNKLCNPPKSSKIKMSVEVETWQEKKEATRSCGQ